MPLHPLVVHGAVVLVPLSLLASVVVSFWPAGRRQYGALTLITAVVAAVLAAIARISGEALLETRPAVSPVLAGHQSWGEAVVFPAAAAVIGIGMVLLGEWMQRRDPDTGTAGYTNSRARLAILVGSGVNVLAAATGLVLVVLAGHSGASSVWG